MPQQHRDRHGDASFGAFEGCAAGLLVTLVLAVIVLAVLKVLGVF